MDNSQHTRGPWSVHKEAIGLLIRGDGTRLVAAYIASEADALLIVAAPKLLAELERQMEWEWNPFEPKNQSDRYKRMKALYAEATGSTHE